MDKRIKEIKKLKADIEKGFERGTPSRPAWRAPGGENYYTDPARGIRPLVITDKDWLDDYRGFLRRAVNIWGGSQDIDEPRQNSNPRAGIENLLVWCVAMPAKLMGTKRKYKKDNGSKTELEISTETKLMSALTLYAHENPNGPRPTISHLANNAGCSRQAAYNSDWFMGTYDKIYPKHPKKGKSVKWDDNRPDLATKDPDTKG